ncbi:hypothetical protein [Neisseria meningitidis]|nr:hypothetical protein [Neisseria meningitidis]
MSTFFRQTAQAMIAKHIDRFPLLKLDQVIAVSYTHLTPKFPPRHLGDFS